MGGAHVVRLGAFACRARSHSSLAPRGSPGALGGGCRWTVDSGQGLPKLSRVGCGISDVNWVTFQSSPVVSHCCVELGGETARVTAWVCVPSPPGSPGRGAVPEPAGETRPAPPGGRVPADPRAGRPAVSHPLPHVESLRVLQHPRSGCSPAAGVLQSLR